MRKKELIKQTELLTQKLLEADRVIAELKDRLADRENDIAVLSDRLAKALQQNETTKVVENEPVASSQNCDSVEATEEGNASQQQNYGVFDITLTEKEESTSDIKEYTVKAIGKIISETVKVNCVLAGGNGENRQELINLVLGRGEVAKEEISALMHSGLTEEEIKPLVDKQLSDTLEYFKNILNQI